jgi:hypothetical protein
MQPVSPLPAAAARLRCQAAQEAELAKLEGERAKLRAQREVQAEQLEHLKTRVLAERWVSRGAHAAARAWRGGGRP